MPIRPSIALLTLALAPLAPAAAQVSWQVIWQEEFEGTTIDPDRWEHMIGDGTAYGLPSGWGNNELEYYTARPENSFVENGELHIVARRESYAGHQYTSARLRTRGLEEFKYGRIEARMRLPRGQGIWPALWMLPTDSPYGGWAASGEIDVLETVNIPTEAHGTLHFGGQWPNNRSNSGTFSNGTDLSQAYHVYSMDWGPDQFRWYVDGVLYHSVSSSQWYSENGQGNGRAPFDHFFHLLLNVAVGGNWPGPPDGSTQFPQTLCVDWVRFSAPEQTPFGGAARPIPGRVEAEDFDEGYYRQAYVDTDRGNNGNAYRTETDVDIEACAEGGFNIGWVRKGEWLEYTVDARQGGVYRLQARVASPSGGRLRIEIDGVDRTGELVVPATGGWQSWTTIAAIGVPVTKGPHTVRVSNAGDSTEGFNLNWIEFSTMRPLPRPGSPR